MKLFPCICCRPQLRGRDICVGSGKCTKYFVIGLLKLLEVEVDGQRDFFGQTTKTKLGRMRLRFGKRP